MADTSAEVAAHWAEIWYRQAGDELASKYFLPFGFTPERVDTTGPAKLFVPLGRLGYAQFHDDEEAGPEIRRTATSSSMVRPRDIERSGLDAGWQELDEALSDVRAAGVCLCQFCAPRQDLSRFDQLALTMQQP